jgi:hypothetical protein
VRLAVQVPQHAVHDAGGVGNIAKCKESASLEAPNPTLDIQDNLRKFLHHVLKKNVLLFAINCEVGKEANFCQFCQCLMISSHLSPQNHEAGQLYLLMVSQCTARRRYCARPHTFCN